MRYYSTQRPLTPGAYPSIYAPTKIHNFDERTYCEDIGREAWGYIEFIGRIPDEVVKQYELTMSGVKRWYGVTSWFDDKGRSGAAITTVVESETKPENTSTSTSRRDIYLDYFDSLEAAEKHVEDAKNA